MFLLVAMALSAVPAVAEMIVSDRTMEDMKEAEAALLAQWRKESAAAGYRFKGGGTYTDMNGYVFKYGLTRPVRVEPGVKYPLFIGGTGWALAMPSSQAQYPCYVMSVYIPTNLLTPVPEKHSYTWPPDYKSVTVSAYKAIVDKLVAEDPNIDASRVWVEGASKFGAMAWLAGYSYPDTFAAVLPSVGGCDFSKTLVVAKKKVGIWMFYGVLDGGTVEEQLTKRPHVRTAPQIYKVLHDAGYDPILTVYTHGDHHEYGFTDSLVNPEWNDFTRLRKWLFEQKKPTPTWPVITSPTTALGTVGKPFTYTITAGNEPQSFGAVVRIEHAETPDGTLMTPKEDLPKGLSFDPRTGVISGTPGEAGRFFITLNATSDKDTGITTLQLTIKAD